YRQPIDWTSEGLDESHKVLWDWANVLDSDRTQPSAPPNSVLHALSDDLNTSEAITHLHALRRAGNLGALRASLDFMGIGTNKKDIARNSVAWPQGVEAVGSVGNVTVVAVNDIDIPALIAARAAARKSKNFKESDRIRDELLAKGIVLKD